jgi:hypothetical protein
MFSLHYTLVKPLHHFRHRGACMLQVRRSTPSIGEGRRRSPSLVIAQGCRVVVVFSLVSSCVSCDAVAISASRLQDSQQGETVTYIRRQTAPAFCPE